MKRPTALALLIGLSLLINAALLASDSTVALQDGDIVFHRSQSNLSQAIALVTGSEITHMGMVLIRDGEPWVIEAGGTVHYTTFDDFTSRGVGRKYVVKRLAHADSLLAGTTRDSLHAIADKYLGRSYDGQFNWSDDQLYCSELVWKIYHRVGIDLGSLRKLGEFKLEHPIVREQLRRRYGEHFPLEEPVIAPSDIFACPKLVTITQH